MISRVIPATRDVHTRPRVLLVCPGLDHAQRGFESFARDCFEALRGVEELSIELVKGSGGAGDRERAIPTLRRDRAPAVMLGRLVRRPDFVVEHLSFSATLLPVLWRRKPHLVYFSEWHVGLALSRWRAMTGSRLKLLLCNGTMSPGPYDHLDLVQQLTPAALEYVVTRGARPESNVQLPLGFHIEADLAALGGAERRGLRRRLGLPENRRIVLSVAAVNRHHKRLDYLIEEVAAMPEPRPYLLLVGQEEEETPSVRSLAEARLGRGGFGIRTVPHEQVGDLYRAGDVFVLASLWEGLPRALVEAAAHGLPCVAHDYAISDYALGPHGFTADFRQPGGIRAALSRIREADLRPGAAAERHRFVYERFSWDRLRPRYVELLLRCANGVPAPGNQSAS